MGIKSGEKTAKVMSLYLHGETNFTKSLEKVLFIFRDARHVTFEENGGWGDEAE